MNTVGSRSRKTVGAALVGVLLLAGTATAARAEDTPVRLGYYNCDHMTAAVIARDAGIFEQLGLKVELTGNGKVPEAMAAGQMDVGYVSLEMMMRAFLKGAPIVVAANNHLGGAYYLLVSNEIRDPQDLIGKKVALGTEPEKMQAAWVQMAKQLGIPPEGKNYETFKMVDRDEYLALKTGKLAGQTTCDPWASMAEYEKVGHVIAADGKLPNGEWGGCCVFTMSKEFAKGRPELAKKMILAHAKALAFIYTRPQRAAEIFAASYQVPLEVALMTIWKKTVKEGRTMTWEINRKNFQSEVDYDFGVGTLEAKPNLDEFLNTELIAQAGTDDFSAFIKGKVDPVFPAGMPYEDWRKKAYAVEGKAF